MPDITDSLHLPPSNLMEALKLEDEVQSIRWVKKLLAAGEDPNQYDHTEDSYPLLEACSSGRFELVEILIEAGAEGSLLSELSHDLAWAIPDFSSQIAIALIQSGYQLSSMYTESEIGEQVCYGENLITRILISENYDLINALIPYGILDFVNIFDCEGNSPLSVMAQAGNLEQARWLIRHDADVNANCKGRIGSTALDLAIENTDLEMTRFLLAAGGNPNIPTWMWKTATERAIKLGNDFQIRRKESRVIPDAVQIREMIVKACSNFPSPTMPNGRKPEDWPPKSRTK